MPPQSLHVPDDSPPAADTIDFRKIALLMGEKLWLIVLCVVLSGLATVVYLYRAVPLFEATATVKLDSAQPRIIDLPGNQDPSRNPQFLDQGLKDARRLLLSPVLLLEVVQSNALATDRRFTIASKAEATDSGQLAQRLFNLITVEIPRNDTVLFVTVEHANPELAAQLANSLVDQLILHSSSVKEGAIRTAAVRLQGVLDKLQDELRTSDRGQQTNRNQSLELSYQQMEASQHLTDLNRTLVETKLRRIAMETEANEVERLGTNVDALLQVPSIANSQNVVRTRTELVQQETLFSNLKQRYKQRHPRYIESENRIATFRQTLAVDVAAAARGVKFALEAEKAKESALKKSFDAKSAELLGLTRSLIQRTNNLDAMDSEHRRAIYERVEQGVKEAAISGELLSNPLTVWDHAKVPLKPTKPDKLRVTVLGLLAGLVLGVGLALALGLVDSSFKSVEDAERYLNLPVIGAVPRVPAIEAVQSQVVMMDEEHFIVGEAFRSLRTSVAVLAKERELRSFVFTSATPEEGKTFCALNYAASLAQQGLRTLLIECDLRRPMAAVALAGLKPDAPGVTDYLKLQPVTSVPAPAETRQRNEGGLSFSELRRKQRGPGEAAPAPAPAPASKDMPSRAPLGIDEIIQKTEHENLSFVSAGGVAPNPSELLARQGINRLIGEAVRRFDRVVIDAAPMLGISDSLLLVNHAHATCLVVRAHRTPRKVVMRAVDLLQRAEAPLLGVILNDLSATRSDQYGDYYQHYGRETKSATKAV
jgi:polysaccharide biosynthesis transport protein